MHESLSESTHWSASNETADNGDDTGHAGDDSFDLQLSVGLHLPLSSDDDITGMEAALDDDRFHKVWNQKSLAISCICK